METAIQNFMTDYRVRLVMPAFVAAMAMLPVMAICSSAQDWLEVRTITPPAGQLVRIDLGDTAQLLEGQGSLLINQGGRWMTMRVPTSPDEVRFRFERERLGPLELRLIPDVSQFTVESRLPAQRAPLPPPPQPLPPPPPRIAAAPPAYALVTPPLAPPGREHPATSAASTLPEITGTPIEAPRAEELAVPGAARLLPIAPPAVVTAVERSVPTGTSAGEAEPKTDLQLLGKPDELAIFGLGTDLMKRGLFGEAIVQFEHLLADFPRTRLRFNAQRNIGLAYKNWGEEFEAEALRQQDLRRSGVSAEAIDGAIDRFGRAVTSFRDAMNATRASEEKQAIQVEIAESMHGEIRARFQKGGVIQDSPVVVVEYLKAAGDPAGDLGLNARAKLGIAQYFRDLGDARLLNRATRDMVRRAYDRAVEAYVEVIDEAPGSEAAGEALIDLARLYDRNLEMRKFELAAKYYDMLISRYPAGEWRQEAAERSRYIKENYL